MPKPEAAVAIRDGRPEDADALARLHVKVWRATYRDFATPEAFTALDEAKRLPYWRGALSGDVTGAGVRVAAEGDAILGVVSFGPSHQDAFGGRTEIKHLYVDEAAQGRGVGRRLLNAVLKDDDAARPGVALAVVRENTPARRFYGRMGGAEIGTFTDPGPLWKSENIVVAWD